MPLRFLSTPLLSSCVWVLCWALVPSPTFAQERDTLDQETIKPIPSIRPESVSNRIKKVKPSVQKESSEPKKKKKKRRRRRRRVLRQRRSLLAQHAAGFRMRRMGLGSQVGHPHLPKQRLITDHWTSDQKTQRNTARVSLGAFQAPGDESVTSPSFHARLGTRSKHIGIEGGLMASMQDPAQGSEDAPEPIWGATVEGRLFAPLSILDPFVSLGGAVFSHPEDVAQPAAVLGGGLMLRVHPKVGFGVEHSHFIISQNGSSSWGRMWNTSLGVDFVF